MTSILRLRRLGRRGWIAITTAERLWIVVGFRLVGHLPSPSRISPIIKHPLIVPVDISLTKVHLCRLSKGGKDMTNFVKMLRDDRGASAAEYALILAIIGAVIAIAALGLSSSIGNAMDNTASCINNPTSGNAKCKAGEG